MKTKSLKKSILWTVAIVVSVCCAFFAFSFSGTRQHGSVQADNEAATNFVPDWNEHSDLTGVDLSAFPTITNVNFYSFDAASNLNSYTNTLTCYYDGNPVDYFKGTTNNVFPFVSEIPTGAEITFTAANANGNTTPEIKNNVLDINEFGTYEIKWTKRDADNNRDVNYVTIIHSFGAKNIYSDSSNSTSPIDAELSFYNSETDESLTSRANVTTTANLDLDTFVHTNQTPVWINSWGNGLENGKDVTVTIQYKDYDGSDWKTVPTVTPQDKDGYYFVTVSGRTPNGLLDNRTFTNYFAFEISSTSPYLVYNSKSTWNTFDGVTKPVDKILSSSDINDSFCNEGVTIDLAASQTKSPFDKPYRVTYSCVSDDVSDAEYNFTDKEYVDGTVLSAKKDHYARYTITVHFGTQQSHVVSTFTVDKTPIEIQTYFGYLDKDKVNSTDDAGYRKSSETSYGITGADSIFFLNNFAKESGVAITARVRYYNFVYDGTIDSEILESGDLTYVKAKYKLNNVPTPDVYAIGQLDKNNKLVDSANKLITDENGNSYYQLTNSGKMGEGLSAPGLYEFEVLDSAWNTYFYYVYLDNYTPEVLLDETDPEKYTITYGDYKAIETSYEKEVEIEGKTVKKIVKVEPRRGRGDSDAFDASDITLQYYVTDTETNTETFKATYLITKIVAPENGLEKDGAYPTTINDSNWKNTQQLREVGNDGFITNNFDLNADGTVKAYYRKVNSDSIVISKNIKSNEGLYNYGAVDANENISNQGQISISFDLANVQIVAKIGDDEKAFMGNTFPRLTNGSEVRGTSFNSIELTSAYLHASDAINDGKTNVPDFSLKTIKVKFTPKNTGADADTNYFGTQQPEITIFDATTDSTLTSVEFTAEGLYEFVWDLTFTGTDAETNKNKTDDQNNKLYNYPRTQFIVIDRTSLLANSTDPKLTFQTQNEQTKKALAIDPANSSYIADSTTGKVTLPSNLAADSNLTPVRIENVGINGYKINKNTINPPLATDLTADRRTALTNSIADLFKIKTTVNAQNGGETIKRENFNNYSSDKSAYSTKAEYSVVLSDGLNSGIMFNANSGEDANALGATTAFKFNINRLEPPANFVSGELTADSTISSGNILGYNTVNANNSLVYDVTKIEDNVASIQPGKSVYLAFDKTITYTTSDENNPYVPKPYPHNAEIKEDEVVITLTHNNRTSTLKTKAFSNFEGSDRYYIDLNNLIDERDQKVVLQNDDVVTLTLIYKGTQNDFYLHESDTAHLTKTYKIYFDDEAPHTNLDLIKEKDKFYNKQIKDNNNLTAEQKDNYFYTLEKNFTFEKDASRIVKKDGVVISDTSYLDTYKIFYRLKSTDITGKDNNLKTLSEEQAEAWELKNHKKYPGPVFEESNTNLYRAFNYGTQPSILKQGQVCEIVEVDLAGNLTSYFVCLEKTSELKLTVSVKNYKDSNNSNYLGSKSSTISKNSGEANRTFYSVNSQGGSYVNSFTINSFNSYINNYFVYQIYDITDVNDTIPLDDNYSTSGENNLPSGNIFITSSPVELTKTIVNKMDSYNGGAWHDTGAVFEIRIYDRLNANWLTLTLFNRPLNADKFWPNNLKNETIDNKAFGAIESDKVDEDDSDSERFITITNPTFNRSFSYANYVVKRLSLTPNVADEIIVNNTNNGSEITYGIPIDSENALNYSLETTDNYGFVQRKYFSSVGDFAEFVNSTNASVSFAYNNETADENNNIVKTVKSGNNTAVTTGSYGEIKNLLDKLNLYAEANNLNAINHLDFYADNLMYQYNTAFKKFDTIKIEVCRDPFATNLVFDTIDVADLTYSQENGLINLPKVENAFYIYKISIGYKNELNDKSIDTVYGAYYSVMPVLTVTDSHNNPLYFSDNKIRTTYADVVINSQTVVNNNDIKDNRIAELDAALNSRVYRTDKNTDENDVITSTEETLVTDVAYLRIDGTNYKKIEATFRIVNELLGAENDKYTFTIIIDSANYPIYQVVKNPDTSNEQIMAMSSRKFSAIIGNREIPGNQYFTNDADNTEIRLAVDKPLEYEIVQGIDLKTKTVIDETGAEITDTEDSKYATYSAYTIYRIYSTNPKMFSHEEYVKITYTDKLNINTNNTLANLFQDNANPSSSITSTAQTLTLTYNNNGVYQGSRYIGLDYYASIYINNKLITTNRNGRIVLSDAGFYNIVYRDIAGNTHTFNYTSQTGAQTTSQQVNLLNKILVDVESDKYSGELIDNMALENTVRFSVANVNIYGSSLSINAKYNGETINFGAYETLTNGGVYEISLSAIVNNTSVTSNYTIYLVKPEEQRLGLEFIANNLNNTTSQVTNVLRRDASNPASVNTDVTNIFRINEGIINNPDAMLLRLRMSPYESGNGLYTVNVSTTYKTIYKPQVNYTFRVLIGNSNPIINSNVAFGKEVTKKIVLSWTPSDIYRNYGEVNISIGENTYNVTANDRYNDQTQSVTLTKKGTYNIDISTPSGMILTRYTVIKDDPINAVGIILIVIGSVALVTGLLLFFLLRNKMKVK